MIDSSPLPWQFLTVVFKFLQPCSLDLKPAQWRKMWLNVQTKILLKYSGKHSPSRCLELWTTKKNKKLNKLKIEQNWWLTKRHTCFNCLINNSKPFISQHRNFVFPKRSFQRIRTQHVVGSENARNFIDASHVATSIYFLLCFIGVFLFSFDKWTFVKTSRHSWIIEHHKRIFTTSSWVYWTAMNQTAINWWLRGGWCH